MCRRLFAIFLTIFMTTALLVFPAMAVPVVSLVPTGPIVAGQAFDVQALVSGSVGDLTSFGFDVVAPGSPFAYTGSTMGPGLDDNSSGFGNVSGVAFPDAINADNFLLATLHLMALTPGTGLLSIAGDADAWSFSGLNYLDGTDLAIAARLEITVASAPVPEPATLLLFGSGLAAIMGIRRKI